MFSLSKLTSFSSWSRPKNEYLRESGRGFNSRDAGGQSYLKIKEIKHLEADHKSSN